MSTADPRIREIRDLTDVITAYEKRPQFGLNTVWKKQAELRRQDAIDTVRASFKCVVNNG